MVGKLCAGIKLSAISIGWQPKQKRNIKTQNILRVGLVRVVANQEQQDEHGG